MLKDSSSALLTYSPSDLVRFVESPFASWMARFELERPDSGIDIGYRLETGKSLNMH